MKPSRNAASLFIFILNFAVLSGCCTTTPHQQSTLHVAIYRYVPEPEAAIEKLETAFEADHKDINLELELLSPYTPSDLKSIKRFDLAEIDVVALNTLLNDPAYPKLDPLPQNMRQPSSKYVGCAVPVVDSDQGKYVLPHWICGNFLVFWSGNDALKNAKSFQQVLTALDPKAGNPLFANMWGGGTLGEIYADAVLDIKGAKFARAHLLDLAGTPQKEAKAKLVDEAFNAVVSLTKEIPDEYRKHLAYFKNLAWVYPRSFASSRSGALLGYSERAYYIQRELLLKPDLERKAPAVLKPEDIEVRQFPFSTTSKGTPSWVDGFVIPKGSLKSKEKEIRAFLAFVLSEKGYEAFLVPKEWGLSSYLLPAHKNGYSPGLIKQQPTILEFKAVIDASFPVNEPKLMNGMDKAGEEIKKGITAEIKKEKKKKK